MENFRHGTGLSPLGKKKSHQITEILEKDITDDCKLGEKQSPQVKGEEMENVLTSHGKCARSSTPTKCS